ncbi:NAD-dependent epimerase/dehydratase family protein [Candidatus Pelagibacter sp.]|nr:NAD-dependent epimerase/dehydratase family protein [Candidatus Pelagibacter sp.]
MKIIITGGAGFIGSHLAEYYSKLNYEIVILDNFSTGRRENLDHIKEKIKLIECDISINGEWVKHFKNTDYVFHLAALADIVPSIKNPINYFNSNVQGTFNIINLCKDNNIKKIIYTASSSCYGIPKKYPTKETSEIDPQYPYALTKRLGEEIILHYSYIYNLDVVSLRLFNVYGTRSRTSGTYGAMFGVFLAQKLAGKPFTVVGDGEQTRDFTYVSDIVEALVTVAKNKCKNKIYNIGSGKTISINKVIELLDGERTFIQKRPGEPDCTYADISLIKNDTGWNPKIDIKTGIKELMKNIDYWKKAPVWNPDSIKEATKDWFKYLKNK